ncbi:hypothetical protein [uncultured Parabacteroides sp.]|uniref:hypothetical protein n=1 Tax=uncultured Parabacteroides sp. TaxID=512312 RepID=UPI00259B3199|nr:hypothetical protein [uncultured Parabacteroides sp.]
MTIRNKWLYLIRLSLSVCLLTAFAACSNETAVDGGDPDAPGQPVTLSLQIGTEAEAPTVPLTKADPRATDGEYIHSLVVLVTNTHDVVEKVVPFTFTATETSQMETGDLESCTSRSFTLTTGAKRFYAFANYEGLSELNDIQNTQPGNQLALPSTVTWDKGQNWTPGDVDDVFIPMTALREVRISSSTKSVSIELVRLLSKLEVSFCNSTADEITVTGWNVGDFNPTINLFKEDVIATLTDGWEIHWKSNMVGAPPVSPIALPAKGANQEAVSQEGGIYYVSESERTGGFIVGIAYTRGGGQKTDTKQTARTKIPRNHIWPLEILFSDYRLKIEGVYGNPPIGGYPLAETTDNLSSMLECILIGGGPFRLQATLEATGNIKIPQTITWSYEPSEGGHTLVKDLEVSPDGIITGTMAGSPVVADGKEISEYTFSLIASDSKDVIASFKLTLKFKDKFETIN